MLPFATQELVKYRQQELVAEADKARLAAQARANGPEGNAAPWESTIGRVRHVFSVFASLPRQPQVRLVRSGSRA
jgi:hypothetical protein